MGARVVTAAVWQCPQISSWPERGKSPWVLFGSSNPRTEVDHHSWSGQAGSQSRPLREAIRSLQTVSTSELGSSGLSALTQAQVYRFLSRITHPNSTYASIVPDDDGVAVLHWVAGDMSLQVDVTEDGPDYLWMCDGHSPARCHTQPQAIYHVAELALRAIAQSAEISDRNWSEHMCVR